MYHDDPKSKTRKRLDLQCSMLDVFSYRPNGVFLCKDEVFIEFM